ncbi:hypothetical protein E2C01_039740 [Portunus trituberculatus]|uniref:Uncharacterized protein n=1 Tax=Portunus trituberculatus TaxID=210409 RepID=A0A5B7FFI7_PORTR|nr:hypothetical protein [Portunus trituberculatus]
MLATLQLAPTVAPALRPIPHPLPSLLQPSHLQWHHHSHCYPLLPLPPLLQLPPPSPLFASQSSEEGHVTPESPMQAPSRHHGIEALLGPAAPGPAASHHPHAHPPTQPSYQIPDSGPHHAHYGHLLTSKTEREREVALATSGASLVVAVQPGIGKVIEATSVCLREAPSTTSTVRLRGHDERAIRKDSCAALEEVYGSAPGSPLAHQVAYGCEKTLLTPPAQPSMFRGARGSGWLRRCQECVILCYLDEGFFTLSIRRAALLCCLPALLLPSPGLLLSG